MVSEETATEQVRRFRVYGDYKRLKAEGVLPELRKALMKSSDNDERVIRIVDAIIDEPNRRFCPMPGEIQAVARNTADYPEPMTRQDDCDKCDGTGWRIVAIQTPKRGTIGGATTAAEACGCRKVVPA